MVTADAPCHVAGRSGRRQRLLAQWWKDGGCRVGPRSMSYSSEATWAHVLRLPPLGRRRKGKGSTRAGAVEERWACRGLAAGCGSQAIGVGLEAPVAVPCLSCVQACGGSSRTVVR